MVNDKHLESKEIIRYMWSLLPEEEEMRIVDHIADCDTCAGEARAVFLKKLVWDNMQLKTLGELYWREKIDSVLQRTLDSTNLDSIKKKLNNWIDRYRSKLAGFICFSLSPARKRDILTELPASLLSPDLCYHFIPEVAVAGEKSTGITKVVSQGDQAIHVIYDDDSGDVVVRIEKGESVPSLVILAPEEGMPRVAGPEKIQGTNYYSAYFEKVSRGDYSIIFSPSGIE